jgi:hypothetical protein
MPENTNSVPANLILVSDKELFVAAMAFGAVLTLGYVIGKERQRKFVEKHMFTFAKS